MPAIPDDDAWAVTEFLAAEWGDARRTQRWVALATVFAHRPGASRPEACGNRAMLKAAYRFFDHEAVAPQAIVESPVVATSDRLATIPRVLAVQETTEVDGTAHPATTGLGPLATPTHQGLHVHTTLALTPERLPLRLLAPQVWARDPAAVGKRTTRHHRPMADKERQQWLTRVEAVCAAPARCPQTHLVCLGDREADVDDLCLQERPSGVDLLVRAAWNRRVDHAEHYLWTKVVAHPVAATLTVRAPRRGPQPARQATVAVRWCLVLWGPPTRRTAEKRPRMAVWAVQAVEEQPPAGGDAITWALLTTCAVHTPADAVERVAWYACRWGIEVWHKVLKSGCRIEARPLETADRLRRCLAVYSVLAWRLLDATLLSRALPEAPCTALLEPAEWQALSGAIHVTATPPATPPPLRQAIPWIGRLGGFLTRRGAGEPGVTVLWRGFQHLTDLTFMYRIMRPPSRQPTICGS
jgi:hypothetical protein